jgi:hypothetical protein
MENALERVDNPVSRFDSLTLEFQALSAIITKKHPAFFAGETGAPPTLGAIPLEIKASAASQPETLETSSAPTPWKCRKQPEHPWR